MEFWEKSLEKFGMLKTPEFPVVPDQIITRMVNEYYDVEPFYNETQIDMYDFMQRDGPGVRDAIMENRVKQNIDQLLQGLRPYIKTQVMDEDGRKRIRSFINIGTKKS